MQLATDPSRDDLEHAEAHEIIQWAHRRFGDGLVATCSFGDAVMPSLVARALPGAEIVLLDTNYLFAETLWFAERVCERFGLRLRHVIPDAEVGYDDMWMLDTDSCCRRRKVEPLQRVLADRRAWVTGLRRADGPSRLATPVAARELQHNVVKINPIATWSDTDVARYSAEYDLPTHPLADRGYPSIGCWPCTRPVGVGEDARAGRWSGSGKTECGLHLSPAGG